MVKLKLFNNNLLIGQHLWSYGAAWPTAQSISMALPAPPHPDEAVALHTQGQWRPTTCVLALCHLRRRLGPPELPDVTLLSTRAHDVVSQMVRSHPKLTALLPSEPCCRVQGGQSLLPLRASEESPSLSACLPCRWRPHLVSSGARARRAATAMARLACAAHHTSTQSRVQTSTARAGTMRQRNHRPAE